MKNIEDIIKNTMEESQNKVDWTKAWSKKYPVLKQSHFIKNVVSK